jgi:hypothetical protein
MSVEREKDKSKVHKLSLKGMTLLGTFEHLLTNPGSAKYVAEFVSLLPSHGTNPRELTTAVSILHKYYPVGTNRFIRPACTDSNRRFQRGVYPAEDFTAYVTHSITQNITYKLQSQEIWPHHASLIRRPSQSLHQKDHVPTR